MVKHYALVTSDRWRVSDPAVVATAVAVAAIAHPDVTQTATTVVCAVALVVVWMSAPASSRWLIAAVFVVMVCVGLRSTAANRSHTGVALGDVHGWATVVDDPRDYRASSRIILNIDEVRHELWARRPSQRQRVMSLAGGDWVLVAGESVVLDPVRARRVRHEHVQAEFIADYLADVRDGSAVERSVNRVRDAVAETSARWMNPDHAALFAGLVIGDDRRQSAEMTQRFRASGLSHLTAVSGQNLTLLLAAAAPALAVCGPRVRWVISVMLVMWFAAITRFEPSILRAALMAIGVLTRTVTGRGGSPLRLLAWAVIVMVMIDPFITTSVGLWLSVGATVGVIAAVAVLGRADVSSTVVTAVAVTVGAQVGVMVPMLAVFSSMPVWATPVNLVAVPVAGAVMVVGIPAVLIAAVVPPVAPLLMTPLSWAVGWVDTAARIGEAIEPDGPPLWLAPMVVVLSAAVLVGTVFAWAQRSQHERSPTVG